ncbi:DUF6542 domain-containing protein [Nocardia takedensis]|uniref:DUF6542 domain-containing protein n=1 Tax=Nocardia takedensis TaxID=259390 RepID=UPI001C3F3935|nr:DUF6542 domain-containing protein [Nocardia takedensis]
MAASQRVRSRVPAPQRSILPSVSGIPAGAAILIAVACTFLGFFIDANGGGDDLTGTFAALYVVGCVAAVCAVRYRGLFTAMVLPPLLLFLAVPLAYQQLTEGSSTGVKDILLNLAIPLVDRFPVMMLATSLVLALGGLRIYLHRNGENAAKDDEARRGTSWGRDSTVDRARKGAPAKKSAKTAAGRAGSGKGGAKGKDTSRAEDAPVKRRPRPKPEPIVDIADQKTDKYEPPRPGGKRPSDEVADKPPRVAAKGQGQGRPREGRPAQGRGNAARQAAAVPRADEPPRGGRQRGEAPPHPRPNVRYREREPQRAERRKPEKR